VYKKQLQLIRGGGGGGGGGGGPKQTPFSPSAGKPNEVTNAKMWVPGPVHSEEDYRKKR